MYYTNLLQRINSESILTAVSGKCVYNVTQQKTNRKMWGEKEMFMRKKNEITEYVAAALIFVCAVAVSLGIFLVCTQNSIERNSQKVIKTNVSRQSEHIKAILDIHYGYLRGIAKEIGKSEELVSDENMEMLISLEEETALERTALIEADGTAHYDNGAEKNVSLRRYFKEGMEEKKH